MQIVVNTTEEEYESIKKHPHWYSLGELIANGIPLPKGHGRIGDLDALEKDMIGGIKKSNYEEGYAEYFSINNVDDCVDCVRYADAIIEADKEEACHI